MHDVDIPEHVAARLTEKQRTDTRPSTRWAIYVRSLPLPKEAKHVAEVLVGGYMLNGKVEAWPSVATLKSDTGGSEHYVMRGLRGLVRYGVLLRTLGSGSRTDTYALAWPETDPCVALPATHRRKRDRDAKAPSVADVATQRESSPIAHAATQDVLVARSEHRCGAHGATDSTTDSPKTAVTEAVGLSGVAMGDFDCWVCGDRAAVLDNGAAYCDSCKPFF